ncbi:hypothetical protein BCR36DRAFT_409439 [Piromyces finnis]|uniref:BHLH domain-containing protein n=1 Tax=Piromyces finnis TaxID=1754191 RepID=A0A1Y1VI91_9FUNG|nr:hypothetical protein BCR36DRAFT_409439 [Piromyces finnis]|eukprot:ORX57115.1 hypothetical protein BCR36DRAFT_409439 [Piromyces finnis]
MTTPPINTTLSSTNENINSVSSLETETSFLNYNETSLNINKESKDNIDSELKEDVDSKEKDKMDDVDEKDDSDDEKSTRDRDLRIKRENHNALERKRRVYQKSKLEELKNRLPLINTKKSSTITIMCKAIEYIDSLKKQLEESHSQNKTNSEEVYKNEINSLYKRISILVKENERLKYELEVSRNKEIKKESIIRNEKKLIDKKINKSEVPFEYLDDSNLSNKKQKLNSGESILSLNKISTNNKSDKDDNNDNSNGNKNKLISNTMIDLHNNNNSSINSSNGISHPITDKNLNLNKTIDIPSTIASISTTQHSSLFNPIANTNEPMDLSIGTPLKLSSNNTNQITTPDNLMLANISTLSSNNNQNMNNASLQYSVKTIPISTPPESNILDSHSAKLPIQNIPVQIQESSPVQLQQTKNNIQQIIVQHPPKGPITTPVATPINSPSPNSINVSVNSINPQLTNINMTKHGSLSISNKINTINTLNPSPIMNYHHSMAQDSSQTINTLQNSQRLYSSNMQTYRRTRSYPIQSSSQLVIQTQGSLYVDNSLNNPQLQILATPNQGHSSINSNANFQFPQNITIQNQNVINMPPTTSIQISNNSFTLAKGSSLPANYIQPNYINHVNTIQNLNTFNSNGEPLQIIQQPLPSTIINQNIVNPQIPKNDQNLSNTNINNNNNNNNNNNIIYYY